MKLTNKSVLITGASRGLGRALMRACADAGARVVGFSRSAEEMESVAAELRRQGLEAHALASDIRDKHAIYPLVGITAALVGPIDVLIHNASTLGPTPLHLLLETQCEDLSDVLEVNLVGPFRLTKAIAGNMVLRGEGLIVHITSDASTSAYPGWGAYSVSKAGLDHLGRLWAAELEGTGVRFITVDPGEMDTRMHRDALPDADPSTLARPEEVATTLVSIIAGVEAIVSGARIEARQWRKP
jgi:NAD(P)-dependent dehydrogenase (short-subunit alcohol dehydrogenase family)